MSSSSSSKLGAAALSAAASSNHQCAPAAALIFLHGLGDTPAGWSSLQHALPQLKDNLKHLTYVFPPAPMTAITINGGMTMPGWFDLYDWPIGVGSQDDPEGIHKSVALLQRQVDRLVHEEGIPKSRIVVGGFSQGGAIALLAAYRSHLGKNDGDGEKAEEDKPEPLAGCVGLSAWLTLPNEFKVSDGFQKIPMFWGHGKYDDKVLFEQQKFGVDKLREQGVQVTDRQYPIGHSSHPDEIQAMADFLDEILFQA